ncbi:MAG: lamin tail domain-containing protein [Saprospiraceae bacterium]|nr:lamin tail domain-containing protein [Saprospiraceae bacterium]
MHRSIVFLIHILVFCSNANSGLFAQIADDFSDGNFTNNPAWQGNLGAFIVNPAGELQLNAPDAGTSTLAVEGNIPDSAVWHLDVRLEFAPSASNLLRIYLLADQANLLQANGYYLEIGENGTADALRFFRQDGASGSTLLATGVPGFVANDPVSIQLRVMRTTQGNWQLEAAANGGAYALQGTAQDAQYGGGPSRYFGFYCLYTATRKDKFFFDNISIQPRIPDTDPPVLLGAQANAATELLVNFNEDLDSASALNPGNYTIVGLGNPQAAAFSGGGRQQVRLQLAGALNTGNYVLETNQVADTLGNVSGVQSVNFQYVLVSTAAEFDLLINEIMADPSPSAGLPEVEWLELYNRSSKTIDLKTLLLSDGGTPQSLPAFILHPDSFVVLTTPANAPAMQAVTSRTVAMAGFPSLNNDGDVLVLTNQQGAVIDQVAYAADWHADANKRNGGWSLERINPELPCLGAENWQSCTVLPGGTPGIQNASLQVTDDLEPPRLLAVFPENSTTLRATFSEGLDQFAAMNTAAYRIDPSRTILSATLSNTDRQEVVITLGEPLETGVVYAFTATAVLQDCSGNSASDADTLRIGLPEKPEPLDVVINEVLFNPATGGVDFVELYNRSDKLIDWQNCFLANFSNGADVEPIALQRLFLPGMYVVFSPEPADIQARFAQVRSELIFPLNLPSLPDDAGNVTLFWAKDGISVTLDSFDYFEDYHNALYSSSERNGVSLERIRIDGPTNDPANWTSAARTAFGSGTPTRPNSQQIAGTISEDLIKLDPPRLSPDGDGFEDFLNILYQAPAPGYAATITIFDAQGIPVKRLARQELLGTSGALRWDGDLEDGTLARPGIYILFLEIYAPQGDVRQEKKTFAVVRQF